MVAHVLNGGAAAPPSTVARARRRLNRALYLLMFRAERALFPVASPAPLDPARVRRVLVARTDRVGDLVVLAPTLAYLRERLPRGARVDVVVSAQNASLLRGDPRIDRVIVRPASRLAWWRTVWALRAARYDAVLSTRILDHLAEGLFAAVVAPGGARISAWRPRRYAGLFTHLVRVPRRHQHVVERLLHVTRTALGDATDAPPPAAAPVAGPEAARRAAAFLARTCGGRPFVAFNAWGSDPMRCFGVARAAELVAGLRAAYPALAVVVTPPPWAAAEAAAIAAAARADAVAVAPASTDLQDLVALVARAAAVVTPDTANMHIAAALGRPLLAVYSAYTATTLWGAWGPRTRVLQLPGRAPVRDAAVADVVRAFATLPAATPTSEPAAPERAGAPPGFA